MSQTRNLSADGSWRMTLEELRIRYRARIRILEARVKDIQEHLEPKRYANTCTELAVARRRLTLLEEKVSAGREMKQT